MGQAALFGVDPEYRHHPKVITPQAVFERPGARLKWYQLAKEETPVEPEIERLAREHLAYELELEGELGFVVLHRCGKDFYFLLVSSWRGSNELWETVFYKDGAKMPGFEEFKFATRHRGTYCVWELAAVWHEKNAWVRYLESARDEAARRAWLGDVFAGPV